MIKRQMKGRVFGRLTVVGHAATHTSKAARYMCLCTCGKSVDVSGSHLWAGRKTSCGCGNPRNMPCNPERVSDKPKPKPKPKPEFWKTRTKHPLYKLWMGIKDRCHGAYVRKDYAGRGIFVHHAWINDFIAFVDYIECTIGMPVAGMSLDRIDNNAGYAPGNLRWATASEQRKNQRASRASLVVAGEAVTFSAFCKSYGLKPCAVYRRMAQGLSRRAAIVGEAKYRNIAIPDFVEASGNECAQ